MISGDYDKFKKYIGTKAYSEYGYDNKFNPIRCINEPISKSSVSPAVVASSPCVIMMHRSRADDQYGQYVPTKTRSTRNMCM